MSSSQGSSALSNGTEDEQREDLHGADKGENAVSLPTAEDCANQLSSIFNSRSVTHANTMSPPQKEETDQKSNTQSYQPSKSIRFATPDKTNHNTITSDVHIGPGGGIFEMKISIEKHHDLCQLLSSGNTTMSSDTTPKRNAWLSYRCFGTVVQSETFTISNTARHIDTFAPMMNTFRVRGSLLELAEYFNQRKNATLRVHLCAEGEVLGTSSVDLRQFTAVNEEDEGRKYSSDNKGCFAFEGRMVQNEYIVKSRSTTNKEGNGRENHLYNGCSPRITVRLCIDRDPASSDSIDDASTSKFQKLVNSEQRRPPATVYSSISSQTTNPTCVDRASSPIRKNVTTDKDPGDVDDSHSLKILEEKEKELKGRETELSKKEKEIYEAVASVEKKRCEWEQWRHRQELEWHQNLRSKEAAMMRVVEERVCTIEKERLSSMEASKNEYEKLEARLRKALIEVEAKERQLKDIELGHQNERKRKLAEIELREKLIKEELKHSVEIGRAKVNAAVEQAVVAEKSAASAGKKVKQIESEMDQLREQHRKTPEVILMHQMAELKGQLADSERRIEAMKAEKNQVTAEKERFRSNVHKLARALRQEREKAMTKRESVNQQVRLSYDEHGKSFVLGGRQDEIQRILADLNKLSQIKGQGCQSPMTSAPPVINHHVCNNHHLTSGNGVIHNNNAPPMPSPPPSRPNLSAQTQQDCVYFGYGMDPQGTTSPGKREIHHK